MYNCLWAAFSSRRNTELITDLLPRLYTSPPAPTLWSLWGFTFINCSPQSSSQSGVSNSNLLPVLLALSNGNRSAYSQNAKLRSTAFSPAVELLSRCNTNSAPRKKERKKRHTTVGPVCGGGRSRKSQSEEKKKTKKEAGRYVSLPGKPMQAPPY